MKAPQGAAARNEAPGGAGAGAPPGALSADGAHRVAAGSQIGRPGAPLRQVARLTLLAPEGHRVDLALLALGEEIAALPLEPMEPGRDHTLVGVDPAPGPVRLADILSVGLARGTALALADGSQCPVEALAPGAVLLTRDHGPRPLRRMLRRTVRAVGTQAPVVIAAGTLDNAADLVLSQHQRLFRYERGPDRPTETAEILLRAGLMADGERIYLRPGGFVDYFVPVLDAHEILYAEGIPVESLEVNAGTLAALPEDLAGEIGAALPGAEQARHFGTEADETAAASLRARLAPPRRTSTCRT